MEALKRLRGQADIMAGLCVSVLIFFGATAQAQSDPLPYSYRLTTDTRPNSAISAYADSGGTSFITYFHEEPFINGYVNYYISWLASNTGIERGLANATTLTGNPFSGSGIIYSPVTGNVQAVYIADNTIRWASGCDGNTTWAQGEIAGTYGAIDLDYVLNGSFGLVAFSGNMDNDSEKETLLVSSVNTYGQAYGTPWTVIDGYSDGTGSHSYDHVQLVVDGSGNYHLACIEEWVKGGSNPSVRRILYITNAGAGLTLSSTEYAWDEPLAFGPKGIALYGSTPYITYCQSGTVYVDNITAGAWTSSTSFAGSQPSIGGSSSRVALAYQDASGQIAFIEDNGTGWKAPWIVDTAAHDPAIAVGGSSIYIYYLRPTRTGEEPATTQDEVFARSNTEIKDGIPPYVRLIWPASNGWASVNTAFYGQDQEVPRLKEECSVDGVNFYACNFTASQTRLGDIPEFASIPNNGTFTAWIQDTDAAGNVGKSSQPLVRKDALAPTTTDDYETAGHVPKSGLWQADNQTIAIAPEDPGAPGTGSGLDCSLYPFYAVNCITWTKYCLGASCQLTDDNGTAYTQPILIAQEGTTVFRYASRDVADNIQTPVALLVMIDKTAPEVDAGPDLIVNAAANINAAATDNVSGIVGYAWTKQSGPGDVTFGSASSEDTTADMSADGFYVLRLTVRDNASNTRYDEAEVTRDTVSPDTADDYGEGKNDVWQTSDQTITLTQSDPPPSSGLDWTKYCLASASGGCDIDGASGTAYGSPVVISAQGITYFRYRSKDRAGNAQPIVERIVKIDKPTSTTTTTASATSTTTVQPATTTTTAFQSTTTTTVKRRCPFRRQAAGEADVQPIRDLRDSRIETAMGAVIASMYYQNMDEIADILRDDEDLKSRFNSITKTNLIVAAELLLHGTATVEPDGLLEMHELLTDLKARAGLKLRMDIDFILRGIESGWLLEWLGVAVE